MKISSILLGLGLVLAACSDYISPTKYASSVEFGELLGTSQATYCTASHIGEGYFLTAAHCARDADRDYRIEGEPAERLLSDRDRDVALFKVPTLEHTPWSKLRCSKPYVGQHIIMVGEPRGYDDIHTFGRVASEPSNIAVWDTAIFVNISGAPGSSGSPVYNEDGQIVAMMVGGFSPWGNLAIAVPSDVICDALVDFKVVR